jgi:hypothetical protein
MKNPAWQEPGAKLPQGHRHGVVSIGPENKHPAGAEPGLTGQTDVAFDSVAPIRFKRSEPAPTSYVLGNVPD